MPAGLPEVFPVGGPALDKTRHERARETRRERRTFANAHRAEVQYGRQLRSIAQQVGRLCRFYDPDDVSTSAWVVAALRRYAQELWPWAVASSQRMLADVMRRDDRAWARLSANMGRALRAEVQGAPTGELMRAMLHEQASLITSLPIDAAHRVHEWTVRGIEGAARPATIAEEIYRTGEVTKSRAMLIARTEVARTSSKLVEARARFVGSTHYRWMTAGDVDVRPLHKKLDGKVFAWDDPPVIGENGERGHPGTIYNCFTGDTLFDPIEACTAIFRASYCGPIVILMIANSQLGVTPNHPILTPIGLIPAYLLQKGDEVCAPIDYDGRIMEIDQDRKPTTFEEAFQSLSRSSSDTMTLPIDSFYGDRVEGNVEVVRPADYLNLWLQTVGLKKVEEIVEPFSHVGVYRSNLMGRFSKVSKPDLSGFLDVEDALFGGHHPHAIREVVAFRSQRDAVFPQYANYGHIAFEVEPSSYAGGTHATQVELDDFGFGQSEAVVRRSSPRNFERELLHTVTDRIWAESERRRYTFEQLAPRYARHRILDKGVRNFSGHVYTSETLCGYYSVGNGSAIAKNCRCVPEPVVPEELAT